MDTGENRAIRAAIREVHRADEEEIVRRLLGKASFDVRAGARIQARAHSLVEKIRAGRRVQGGIDIFLQEYDLSTEEGITLMCLAEALLRVPDAETADALIRDRIGGHDWTRHLGKSDSLFVNASTWALMLTGRVVDLGDTTQGDLDGFLSRLVARTGEPVIRAALTHAMHVVGRQFVMGETIDGALARSRDDAAARAYRYSFDMLGEGARTADQAARYFDSYRAAIVAVGGSSAETDVRCRPGISVKLSALHPRYETAQSARVLSELVPRLAVLCEDAGARNIGLTIDAEEAARLDLSLDVIEAVFSSAKVGGWRGFGLAVQAYQKRALPVIEWAADLARRSERRLCVRLVKGAYWDSEIKASQVGGFSSYPVLTRKEATDLSFLACARALFAATDALYPQFATHNAQSVASVIEMADGRDFEFQRLHGMGRVLYDHLLDETPVLACRVYAPVGGHRDLLAYLVRRLLENGANSSFVNRLGQDELPIANVITPPDAALRARASIANPAIPAPRDLYGTRRNSEGVDLDDPLILARTLNEIAEFTSWPAVADATRPLLDGALDTARRAQQAWDARGGEERAQILEHAADLFEAHRGELMALCVREAKKTLADAVSEVREAVDYLRYYAAEARRQFAGPRELAGPTGERNTLSLHGRGTFACISPWNFPLAIFTGQVAGALAAGNCVLAKPAEQTPRIAARAVNLLHDAGVPKDVLHLTPGDGPHVGAALVADTRVDGVVFTGGFETAQSINRLLAARNGPIVPLIAETGGINAMIVDSTALPEQVVDDAIVSAFRSAGQRCSALRLLIVQDDVADGIIEMLIGKARQLIVGDPAHPATDIGPVIDSDALAALDAHVKRMDVEARLLFCGQLDEAHAGETFFAPRIYEIARIGQLTYETFGPILHVVRYGSEEIEGVIDALNDLGFGLTLGIQSRVESFATRVHSRLRVGNTYVNRNVIGAVVGVQPFGGEGLSGTGPKAGGPHYLQRFAVERCLSVNTAAIGGNTSLLTGTSSI